VRPAVVAFYLDDWRHRSKTKKGEKALSLLPS
jgi:hypothetical protein